MKRIAVIGGTIFDQAALDSFLFKLYEKYPGSVIVTGSGQGAEKHVADSARLLGFKVIIPTTHSDFGLPLDCQIEWVLSEANIILIVGDVDSSRPKIAMNWIHRMNMHRRDARGALMKKNGEFISQRTPGTSLSFHIIATSKKTAQKKATKKPKKTELLAA